MKRRTNPLFLLLLTFTFVTALAAIQGQRQMTNQASQEEATPVEQGVMTPKQAEHSKLYEGRTRKLTDSPEGKSIIIGLPWRDISIDYGTFEDYIREFACQADAIIVAVVLSKASQLTADGTFIFTDYELNVRAVLKKNPGGSIYAKQDITVTRPGGVVNLNGKIFAVKDRSFRALETNKPYVLLLSYLPSTGSYKPLNSESSFDISNRQVLRLTDEEPPYSISSMKDRVPTVHQISALAGNCVK